LDTYAARAAETDLSFLCVLRFVDLERLVSVRSSLLQTVASRKSSIITEDDPTVRTIQKELQLRLSAHARGSGQLQAAINAVTMAQKLDVASDAAHVGVLHEYANVLWASEEHGMAIDIQRSLIADPSLVSADDQAKMQRARHLSVLVSAESDRNSIASWA
jgi:putative ubiquitin-RnfH superfamily antitoxin RatB of RatAB toxin-antitoxin module